MAHLLKEEAFMQIFPALSQVANFHFSSYPRSLLESVFINTKSSWTGFILINNSHQAECLAFAVKFHLQSRNNFKNTPKKCVRENVPSFKTPENLNNTLILMI